VFENRVLRRISGPKRGGMIGEWKEFHNEELHSLYFSSNNDQLKEDEMGGACSTHVGDEKCVYNFGW
jgi:hypothetical protein